MRRRKRERGQGKTIQIIVREMTLESREITDGRKLRFLEARRMFDTFLIQV